MTLKNLLGISLDAVQADNGLVAKLLAAAQRNIADAQLAGLSAENRFDAAYKAIMQVAMVALNANGFRTLTSKPGHHQTAIQTLQLSVGLPQTKVIVLDALRKQRNLSDWPERQLLKLNIDAGGVHARRVIDKLIAQERAAVAPV